MLLAPIAGVYFIIVKTRNLLYDCGLFHSFQPKIPTICVGNLTVGGTGKTPHIELLVKELSKKYQLAVLSRGYKRKSKGYKEIQVSDVASEAGDEPLQIKQKFSKTVVAVNADRKEGINQIAFSHPDTQIILLDDAFQHRKVSAGYNILLIDYNRPTWEDTMLPIGNLRDTSCQIKRANAVIITKCPPSITPLEKRLLSKKLSLFPYQMLLFSHIEYDVPQPLFETTKPYKKENTAIAVSGIAEPAPFIEHVKTLSPNIETVAFPDHHNFAQKDIDKIVEATSSLSGAYNILTTEKDAKRLASIDMPDEVKNYLYFVPIKARLAEETNELLINKIEKYVRENSSYRRFYKGKD